jgi:hypothetical protein
MALHHIALSQGMALHHIALCRAWPCTTQPNACWYDRKKKPSVIPAM